MNAANTSRITIQFSVWKKGQNVDVEEEGVDIVLLKHEEWVMLCHTKITELLNNKEVLCIGFRKSLLLLNLYICK